MILHVNPKINNYKNTQGPQNKVWRAAFGPQGMPSLLV
jgi:hypothetical protein